MAEKKTTKKVDPAIVEEQEVKSARVYKNTDRVPCKSITAGALIFYSTKTKERYEWSNYGDIADVLYEDLLSMKSGKSTFLYNPYFVIEDEELLSDKSWAKIKEIHANIEVVDDAVDYLKQSPEKLRELLMQAPEGVKNTVKITASQMIGSGELYDIRIIKIVDEVLGTEFKTFM